MNCQDGMGLIFKTLEALHSPMLEDELQERVCTVDCGLYDLCEHF
jgi:hypothetical protein